ncbi:amidohydrolase family protein [Reinekea blandensis]|uniref:N-acetylglucosamine-6-phosphate deacetylase n=1 Tax=Reinekea blandensis MED297 TaxID=314283 RepID=A4BJA0_9GAMM|nr:amidohydrolase family protein [Reinekea blandensis]EAR07758.1 N-acetylglucosamine-6-phosphate deacetylase [Reinekea sp. MED297] [Reinekea blandensis MED297]
MKTALTGARIFDGTRFIDHSALIVEGSTIHSIVAENQLPEGCQKKGLDGGLLTPGFIDLQINGGGGILFNNDPSESALKTMTDALVPYGVTRLMPTLITDTPEVTTKAIEAACAAQKSNPGVLGIHVEGPFFSTLKNGVHRRDRIRELSDSDWTWLQTMASIPSILTLAPEQVSSQDIQRIVDLGIRVCAGHTNATYDDVLRAHDAGQSGFTHLLMPCDP